jgi:simple sugar transport system substrate-binding protein
MKQVTRRTALTGGAAGIAALALQACGSSSSKSTTAKAATGSTSVSDAVFGSHPSYKFVMVNHVTTNTFFAPTQSGAADACKLLGCSYQWTGSQTSNVGQMVDAINTAVAGKVSGIATTLVAETSFNGPVKKAMDVGVVGDDRDTSPTTPTSRRSTVWPTSARTCTRPECRWAT